MATRRRTVAGLPLRWREFRAIRSDGPGAEGEPISFGLWAVANPDALFARIGRDAARSADADEGKRRSANTDPGEARSAGAGRDDGAGRGASMPYFGLIWPASESLVAKILTGPRLNGLRVLDLGCGLGACGFAAARLGGHVTFLDREPCALEIVRATAREPEWRDVTLETVVGDWRTPPPLDPFDLIFGADVLYAREDGSAVAPFLARHLRADAEAWLADPGRANAERFPMAVRNAGLELVRTERLPTREGQTDVRLLRLRRATGR